MNTANPTVFNPLRDGLSFLGSIHPTDLLAKISLMVGAATVAVWLLSGSLGIFQNTSTEQVLVGVERGIVGRTEGVGVAADLSALLLEKAQVAYAAGQFATPAGMSALEYLDQALTAEPTNARAQTLLDRVLDTLSEKALEAIEQQQFATAVTIVAPARAMRPDHVQLKLIDRQLAAEKQRLLDLAERSARAGSFDEAGALLAAVAAASGESDPAVAATSAALEQIRLEARQQALRAAERREVTRAQQADQGANPQADGVAAAEDASQQPIENQIEELLSQARVAIVEERLVTPEWQNAKRYLTELNKLAAGRSDVVDATDELIRKLVLRARNDSAVGRFESAELWLSEARALDESSGMVARAKEEVDAAYVRQESQRVLSLSELDFDTYVAPEYPTRARQREIEGWVDVEFVVDVAGNINELEIIEGRNLQHFRDPTIDAVRAWVIEPRVIRGRPIVQRVRTRIEYRIQ